MKRTPSPSNLRPPALLRGWPIQRLLFAIFTLIVLASLIPFAVQAILSTNHLIQQRSEERLISGSARTRDRLDDYLRERLRWSEALAGIRPLTTSALAMVRQKTDIEGLYVIQSGRKLFGSGLAPLPPRSYLQGKRPSITEIYTDASGTKPYLAFVAPIPGTDRSLVMVETLAQMRRIIAADTDAIGKGSFGALAGADTIRLIHATRPELEFSPVSPLSAEAVARIRADRRFGKRTEQVIQSVRRSPTAIQKRDELQRNPAASPITHAYQHATGEGATIAVALLREHDWFYVVLVPDSYFRAPIQAQIFRTLLFALLLLLGAASFSYWLSRRFTQPISRMHAVAEAWERGNLGLRLPETGAKELGALSQTFNHMAARLEAYTEQLESQVRVRTRELKEANQKLQAADRSKDEFLSVVSHELRTPINAILGFGSILDDEVAGPLSDVQHRYLKKLLSGADTLLSLVNDLLDMSRMQAGKFTLSPRETSFPKVVRDVLERLEPLAEQRDQRMINEVPGDLPPLVADEQRVGQVLVNLVNNAIKFTPDGGTIWVKATVEGDHLRCEVVDTGIGIAAEDVPKLFKQFGQLDMSSTREAGGTGLGLSISKALVEAHGGEIGMFSEGPGKGASFWFTLPLGSPSGRDDRDEPGASSA